MVLDSKLLVFVATGRLIQLDYLSPHLITPLILGLFSCTVHTRC